MSGVIRGEALRFLIAGACNTIVGYAVYLALLSLLGYALAYTAAYVVGIAMAYFLNVRFVFRVQGSALRALLFPSIYLIQYLVGILVLRVTVANFGVPPQLAILASIVVTVPLMFVLSRLLLKANAEP